MRPLVVVLGGSGFIGSAVAARLAREPIRLRLVARRPSPVPVGAADVSVLTADLTDPAQLAAAVDGADAVLYLLLPTGGWRAEGETSERVNVGVLRSLLRTSATGALVLFAGTVSQAGPAARLPLDGTGPDHPVGAYDTQKHTAERLLLDAVPRGVSLRLPTVYGAGPVPDRGIVAGMARRALAGEPLTVWDGGTVLRDLLHVTDVADAFATALRHPAQLSGRRWVLGTGRGLPLRRIFCSVADAVARRTGRPPVPVTSVPAPATAAGTDAADVVVDASAFTRATGWRPEVRFADGVAELVSTLDSASPP